MTDVATRVERLRERIKRKRDEVYHHLDAAFYSQCRSVLEEVMRRDVNALFAAKPCDLPEYTLRVARPMWWALIARRLDRHEYGSRDEFVRDMRLVVENCYVYNGDAAPASALARRLEVAMEDLFVTRLAVAPPDARDIIRLGKGVTHAQARQLWEIVCRYEQQEQGRAAARQHIVPSQLKCATQRRVIAFLRHKAEASEKNGRTEKTAPAHQQQQQQQQPTRTTKQPVAPQYPTRNILETDADVEFSSEQKPQQNTLQEPQLERVPQNQRSGFSSFPTLSPIHFDESSEGEDDGMEGF
ncbi:DNA-binding protein [Trypanosoma theileri]|uniref:DNA-binding protein n=1 Tax=Trypanosoma theileri TaxID=67003 RepID=A0A1X0NN00_9TRYP|nr:DNA-binding protein [Trypanosoma theileri]ORC85509.1 DNA-binding protein [Trypanosoma theileri]